MPKGPGVVLNSVDFSGGMTHILRAEAAQAIPIRLREKTAVGQDHVERLHRVPLALNVPVASGIAEGFGRYLQNAVVENVQDINTGQIAAGMTRSRLLDESEELLAVDNRFDTEFLIVHGLLGTKSWNQFTPTGGENQGPVSSRTVVRKKGPPCVVLHSHRRRRMVV